MDTTLPNTNGDDQDQGAGDLIAVQLDTLRLGSTAPQAGDQVKFTVEGTVDHVDEQEGCAYVKPEKANGEPIPGDDNQGPTENDLQAKAEQADQESYAQ